MPKPTARLFIATVLLALSSSSCAKFKIPVKINDMQFCSPIPGGLGAVCDNFLTNNRMLLDAQGWEDLQDRWIAEGYSVECTPSRSLGDIKAEIEKLCSVAPCDYQVKKKVLQGLRKLQVRGQQAVHM